MIANSLGINRRRIYDIINVMEALEMISKQSKNWYQWHGQSNLVATLAKLKVREETHHSLFYIFDSTSCMYCTSIS